LIRRSLVNAPILGEKPTTTLECAMRSIQPFMGCVLILALPGADALAQNGQVSSLAGTVFDQSGGVVAGATMTARSPEMIGGAIVVVTDERGQYRFASILPGTYELVAERAGFQTFRRTAIDLRAGLSVLVDAHLEVAGVQQTTSVSASGAVVEVRTSAAAVLISREWLEHLPYARDLAGYMNLVPGVTSGIAFGGTPSANPLSLDGTDVSRPENTVPDNSASVYWFDSIQVASLGANAQYGEYTGARLNAVTRSGSNSWSGLFDFWTMRNGFVGNNRTTLDQNTALRFLPVEILQRWDASPQAGAPIKRDRVWFFLGFERYLNEERPAAFSLLPRNPGEPVYRLSETKEIGKLTAAAGNGIRLEGYIEAEQSTIENGDAGPFTAPEAVFYQTYPGRIGNARLTWTLSPRTLLEARYGYYSRRLDLGPTPPMSSAGPPAHQDTFTGTTTGNYPSFEDTRRARHMAGMTVTRFITEGSAQSHELKAGVEYERAEYRDESGFSGGALFQDFDGAPSLLYISDNQLYRGVHHRTSGFLQDTWQAGARLTIEPGARFGFNYGAVPISIVPPYETSSFSPRVGVAWDVRSDHRTVVRAHYGLYHDALLANVYDQLDPASNPLLIVKEAMGPGQFEEVTRSGGSLVQITMDGYIHHPYVEEYLVGIDREIAGGISLRVQYIHRNFKRSLGYIDTGTTWTPTSAIDPGPDGRAGVGGDDRQITLYYDYHPEEASLVLTNPPDARRHYDGFQIIGTRRTRGRWSAQASYTWARSRGTFDNEVESNSASNDLGINGNFVNPNRALYSGFVSTQHRPHDVKILGTYVPCCGLRVSGIYRYISGLPWSRLIMASPITQLCCVGVELTGARRLPASFNDADLRLEKVFQFSHAAQFAAYADVFNVNNRGVALSVDKRSGPRLGIPTSWREPRTLRLGVRWTF
jgi:hypothetical protein